MAKGIFLLILVAKTNIPDKEQGFDHMNDSIGYLVEIVKPLTRNITDFKPQRWTVQQKRYGI
jgi:hypothetical protein